MSNPLPFFGKPLYSQRGRRGSWLIRQIEKHCSKKPPLPDLGMNDPPLPVEKPLPDGSTVVIIGGGIAGSSLARQLLGIAGHFNRVINVVMVNSSSCNYCGGLVTDLALHTLHDLHHLNIPENVVLNRLDRFYYANRFGSVEVDVGPALVAMLRTSRFGQVGFDDSFKQRILVGLNADAGDHLTIIEPTIVTAVIPPSQTSDGRWRAVLSRRVGPDLQPEEIAADFVALAAGLRAVNRPMMREFSQVTGYTPPPIIEASVTEIDTSTARYNKIHRGAVIIDGIIPNCVAALISKGRNWLTVTSLAKKLTKDDIDTIFNHPSVKALIDLPEASSYLRCHTICGAGIFTGGAETFYGDGWAAIGDLSGRGRVLKDGYFAALFGARLLATALIRHGSDRQTLARYYHEPLKEFEEDNPAGMRLFKLNSKLTDRQWFNRLFLQALMAEVDERGYGGILHAAIRALSTGELQYRLIVVLFVLGIGKYFLRHPLQFISIMGNLIREEWSRRVYRGPITG